MNAFVHFRSAARFAAVVPLCATLASLGCAVRQMPGNYVVGNLEGTAANSSGPEGVSARARVHALWAERVPDGAGSELCIGAGDLLEITVFHWPEMSGLKARVSGAGMVSLPLLGDIAAAGLTERELQDRIAARLREGLVKNPNVNVFVTERTSQQVSITGAVSRPGLVPLTRDRRTLADVISEAGGLSQEAGGKILFYPARGSGRCAQESPVRVASLATPVDITPLEIDLNDQYEPPHENPLALPAIGGDAITVNRGQFLVDGWVASPGAIGISPGMTALSALTAAGGALYPAALSRVVLVRAERGGTKQRIAIDLNAVQKGEQKDVTLQAGDIIQVPPSPIRMLPYGVFWIITNVVRVGAGVSLTAL